MANFWVLLLVLAAIVKADERQGTTVSAHHTLSDSKAPDLLEDSQFHLDLVIHGVSTWSKQAARDVAQWSQQAAQDIKHKLDDIEFTAVNKWIHQGAKDAQTSLQGMNSTDFGLWIAQASKDTGLDQTLDDLQYARLEDLPDAAFQYIRDNPAQTAFYIFNGIVFFAPGTVYGPLLHALGFSRIGVQAGTVASFLQSTFGGIVPHNGWFAKLTSAGMGGYGVAALDRVTRISSLITGVVNQIAPHQNGTADHEEI